MAGIRAILIRLLPALLMNLSQLACSAGLQKIMTGDRSVYKRCAVHLLQSIACMPNTYRIT